MGWVFLEVLAALLIAVGIVWWTMPRKPKGKPGPEAGEAARKRDEAPRG
jgi:hypothetical protein